MRHADICDMETEGWSGQPGWAWGTAAAKHERKLRSKREGHQAAVLARNFSDIQLPKESMEIQSPPVSEGEQEMTEPCMSGKFYHTDCTSLTWEAEVPRHWQHLSWVIMNPTPASVL